MGVLYLIYLYIYSWLVTIFHVEKFKTETESVLQIPVKYRYF